MIQNLSKDLLLRLKQDRSRESFTEFVRYCFKEDGFDWNWHFEYISGELNKLFTGEYKKLMIFVPPQHGKLLEANTPVLTTKGFVKHGELKAGDYVFGQDGKPKRVIANSGVYDWNVNEVVFQSGYKLLAANEHLWNISYKIDSKSELQEGVFDTQSIPELMRKCYLRPYIKLPEHIQFYNHRLYAIENDAYNKYNSYEFQEIKPYGIVKGNCIEVEGGMYLAGYDLIPTHNSSLSSILFPAWALGVNPNTRLGICSYSADLASGFNRKTQLLMTNSVYSDLFPNSSLNPKNRVTVADGTALRNSEKFEIVGFRGFYKSVGVGGSLTGNPLDIGVIDDPFKDRQEADSTTIRNRVWNWYVDVFKTRLNNNSKQLMLFTRWHEDDLAGRILNPENNPYYSKKEADSWTVINLPALREDYSNQKDPRQIGEALWEKMHSRERLEDVRQMNPRTFASLYQQRPAPMEGGTFKRNWFNKVSKFEFERISKNAPRTMYIDGAYTQKTENDPSSILVSCVIGNDLYIVFCDSFWLELPELADKIEELANIYLERNSGIKIEPKASGLSTIQVLKKRSALNISQYQFPNKSGLSMQSDKIQKANSIVPFAESGRIYLVEGGWNESFINECCVFPNGKHDDKVDTLVFAAADIQFKQELRTVSYKY